jgi:hypothetical protein
LTRVFGFRCILEQQTAQTPDLSGMRLIQRLKGQRAIGHSDGLNATDESAGDLVDKLDNST